MFRILEWSKPIKILVVKGIVKSKGLWSPSYTCLVVMSRESTTYEANRRVGKKTIMTISIVKRQGNVILGIDGM